MESIFTLNGITLSLLLVQGKWQVIKIQNENVFILTTDRIFENALAAFESAKQVLIELL